MKKPAVAGFFISAIDALPIERAAPLRSEATPLSGGVLATSSPMQARSRTHRSPSFGYGLHLATAMRLPQLEAALHAAEAAGRRRRALRLLLLRAQMLESQARQREASATLEAAGRGAAGGGAWCER